MARIQVPQQEGEIVINRGGDARLVFEVTDGHVEVPDEDSADFVRDVEGAVIVAPQSTGNGGKGNSSTFAQSSAGAPPA